MESCKIIIKQGDGWGNIVKSQCNHPIYENGMCKKHWTNYLNKNISWENRVGYIDSCMDDLLKGKALKLKGENSFKHHQYWLHNGIIYTGDKSSKILEWKPTTIEVNPNLFVVKL